MEAFLSQAWREKSLVLLMADAVPQTERRTPGRVENMVGPGVVTHANLVNGLRVKQLQKAPLNANGFLSKCQNWSYTFVGGRVANLVQGMPL